MMGKLSIIVPAYNCKWYINRCISSILNQTYKNFELLIIDDGSTDGTGSILEEIKKDDRRIKVFHKENGGVCSARNYGIKKSTGDLICFVDSDDYIEPDMYNTMINYKYDMVCSGIIYENDKKKVMHIENNKKYVLSKEDSLKFLFNGSINGCVWNKIFNAKIIKENNILFDEEIHYAEDYLFVCNYIMHIDSAVICEGAYYHYIQQKDSLMHQNYNEKHDTGLDSYKKMKELMINYKSLYPYVLYGECYMSCLLIYNIYFSKNINRKEKKKLLNKYHTIVKNNYYKCKKNVEIYSKNKILIIIMIINIHICCNIWKIIRIKKEFL